MPLDPATGLPPDPTLLLRRQRQTLFVQLGGTRGGADANNAAAIAAGLAALFPSPAVLQARKVQSALKHARCNLAPQADGESDLDYAIRELRAFADAVAPHDPEAALEMHRRLLQRLEQSRQQSLSAQ